MKVIFLDIDGVVNSTGSVLGRTGTYWEASNGSPSELTNWTIQLLKFTREGEFEYIHIQTFQTICPTAVSLINRLAQKAEAKVVLSSSHRSCFANDETGVTYGSKQHLYALDLYLKLLGFEVELIDITPRLYEARGLEVQQWLEDHPEVERYVILDDGGDFLGNQIVVRTDAHFGFTGADYFKASKELLINESHIIF